jgi:CRISPR/Cas system-associated protein Cas7 (RAMP superfamily)|nr:hypothetical protein [Phocaeicola massiliensis]
MMELTNKNIEEYINRFLDGETTNAEEQAIYRFFCTDNVPAHLKEYAPMFAWYEGGMQGEPKPQAMEDTKVEKRKTFSLRIPVTAWSAGIAAMVVVTLGLGLLVFSGQNLAKNHKWSCYEGSYIEVNGKRITDVKKIMPCIIETLEYANEVEQLARQRIDEIHRSEQEIKEKEDLVNN